MACACRKNLLQRWQKNPKLQRKVYLDNCSGTRPIPEAVKEYFALARNHPFHTESVHVLGLESSVLQEAFLEMIKNHWWFENREVYTVPSAGSFFTLIPEIFPGRHLYCSSIDHPSLQNAFLKQNSSAILDVDSNGLIDAEEAKKKIKCPALILTYAVNHEIGSQQNLDTLRQELQSMDIIFGLDAVQVPGRADFSKAVNRADFFILSPYKFGGLKSMSFAAFSKNNPVKHSLDSDSFSILPGPVDLPLLGAQATALQFWTKELETVALKKITMMENFFIRLLEKKDVPFFVNSPAGKAAGILNISLMQAGNMEEFFALANEQAICLSRFSACTGQIEGPSEILTKIGIEKTRAECSVRISSGTDTSEEDFRILADFLATYHAQNH